MSDRTSIEVGGLQRFFDFFKVLGASLTGITAVFAATGFLIERARLTKLGLPSSTFDLEQYLETGARFFAFLPVLLRPILAYFRQAAYAHLSVYVVEHLPGITAVLIVVGLAGSMSYLFMRKRSARRHDGSFPIPETDRPEADVPGHDSVHSIPLSKRVQARVDKPDPPTKRLLSAARLRTKSQHLMASIPAVLLTLFVLFTMYQFRALERQTAVLNQTDMLFEVPPSGAVASAVVADPAVRFAGAGDEAQAALSSTLQFGNILFSVLVAGLLLYFLARLGLKRIGKFSRPSTWIVKGWLAVGGFFLSAQIVLVPINYGILLDHTRFPEVCVAFVNDAIPRTDLPTESRLVLVHENDDAVYLYSSIRRRMWYVRRSAIDNISYHRLTNILIDAKPQSCSSTD